MVEEEEGDGRFTDSGRSTTTTECLSPEFGSRKTLEDRVLDDRIHRRGKPTYFS